MVHGLIYAVFATICPPLNVYAVAPTAVVPTVV